MPQYHRPKQNPHRHKLRKDMTPQERLFWRSLRDCFPDVVFRRQISLGPYIADFVCYEHQLVIELDGSQHADNPADRVRDAWMRERGFTVLRFWNHEVTGALGGVLEVVSQSMQSGGTA